MTRVSFLLILMDLGLLLAQGFDADAELVDGQLEVWQCLQGLVDALLGLSRFEFLADAVFRQGVEQDVGDLSRACCSSLMDSAPS